MKITEKNFIDEIKAKNQKGLYYVIDNYSWILKTVLKKHLFYIIDHYDECMNDCLLAIWNNIEYYDSKKSSFENWIGGIAKFKSIDYIRKYVKDLENENIEDRDIAVENDFTIQLLNNEIGKEMEDALSTLSEKDRDIFIKLYVEDKSMDDISKDTGMEKSAIYNRISRGKKKLRSRIKIGGIENEKTKKYL